jgi:hypothetical protein
MAQRYRQNTGGNPMTYFQQLTLNRVDYQIRYQTENKAGDQIRLEVKTFDPIRNLIWQQVWNLVKNEVWDIACRQVWFQVKHGVNSQLMDEDREEIQ